MLVDMSSTINTVDHITYIPHLVHWIGISGQAEENISVNIEDFLCEHTWFYSQASFSLYLLWCGLFGVKSDISFYFHVEDCQIYLALV